MNFNNNRRKFHRQPYIQKFVTVDFPAITVINTSDGLGTHYTAKDKTFVSELSDHDLKTSPYQVALKNPKTGVQKLFTRTHVDYTNATHEDIAGYWYSNKEGYKLLLIND